MKRTVKGRDVKCRGTYLEPISLLLSISLSDVLSALSDVSPHHTPASTHNLLRADSAPVRITSSESYIHLKHSCTATIHSDA